MTVKLGSTDIAKAYIGATEATKMYLGSTEVYAPAGGSLTLVGYGDLFFEATNKTAPVIPYPAGTVEGDVVIVALATGTSGTTISAPAGWTDHGKLIPSTAGGGATEIVCYSKIAGAGESSVTLTLSPGREVSGVSVAYRGGAVGASTGYTAATPGTSITTPSIAVDAGSATVKIVCINLKNATVTPTPDHFNQLETPVKTSERTFAIYVTEDEAGPSSTDTVVSYTYASSGAYSIEVEPV